MVSSAFFNHHHTPHFQKKKKINNMVRQTEQTKNSKKKTGSVSLIHTMCLLSALVVLSFFTSDTQADIGRQPNTTAICFQLAGFKKGA